MYINKQIALLLLLLWLFIFGAVGSRASPTQTVAISGQVVDVQAIGVPNATVFMRGKNEIYRVITDNDGGWTTNNLTTGIYEFYAVDENGVTWSTPQQLDVGAVQQVMLTIPPITNLVTHGDFETEAVWRTWQQFNNETTLSTSAFAGQSAAQMGQVVGEPMICSQNSQQGQIWSFQQTIIIPTENPRLSFMSYVETTQTQFNYAWLEVVLLVDNQPTYIIPWGDLWQAHKWTLRSFDLSVWSGQTVTLLFQTVNCSPEKFIAMIDQVSVGTQVPSNNMPTPTPYITPTPAPNATPTPIHTPSNPNANYLGSARQLTACENQGKHHLFIYVEDANGNGIPNINLRVYWPNGEAVLRTGSKGEHPGLVDFPMFKGNYWIEVLDGSSDVVGPLTPDIPQDELCEENGNPVGNSLFHYSYEVKFTKQ